MTYVIYNTKRYGDCTKFPETIVCHNCTLEQAENLAEHISQHYPGQEYMFLVAGQEGY